MKDAAPQDIAKFSDPFVTAKGEKRASVSLNNPDTLWFNTGTLCNIECVHCYIESSPKNDQLIYLTETEVIDFLDQIEDRKWPIKEIGFTGGEPFMNPQMIQMAEAALARGYRVLILTNAMRPMMRNDMRTGLERLHSTYGERMTLRVSIDHWTPEHHESERGTGSFEKTLIGMRWLRDVGIAMDVAGRTMWSENESEARAGFAHLFAENEFDIDAMNPAKTILFPEMDVAAEVPEITTDCWGILGKSPKDVMCSTSRMVVRRKGSEKPAVLACTLLAYEPEFEMGSTLEQAESSVQLNHPHCAKFCVLGGASCSA